jgi:uncharacterized membrane protein YgaE (UPF0421/DUF939 family)
MSSQSWIWKRPIFAVKSFYQLSTRNVQQSFQTRLRLWWIVHSARTAIAATVSLYVARSLRLPEAYWAPVSTLIVMQSTLGAAFKISLHRFIGTALGCASAIVFGTYFGRNGLVFGAAILAMGMICSVLGLDRTAYRFAGITLCIVMMVIRAKPVWIVGIHRFIEVSAGIAVALLVTAVWPEKSLSQDSVKFSAAPALRPDVRDRTIKE